MGARVRTITVRGAGASAESGIAVRWELSRDAIGTSAWGAACLNGEAARLERAWLVWRVEGGTARASLEMELTRGERRVVGLMACAAVVSAEGGDVHVDAGAALAITVREEDGRVLYARTSVLGALLGLGGGVYGAPE